VGPEAAESLSENVDEEAHLVNYRGCSGADLELRTNFPFWDFVGFE
jgi:hypothetical protein